MASSGNIATSHPGTVGTCVWMAPSSISALSTASASSACSTPRASITGSKCTRTIRRRTYSWYSVSKSARFTSRKLSA